MNIFGKGNSVINICNGKNSTIIINGKVIKGDGIDINYTPFNENISIDNEFSDIILESSSEDVELKKGNKLCIEYSGKYAGDKEPSIKEIPNGKQLILKINSVEFQQDSKVKITVPDCIKNIKIKTGSADIHCEDNIQLEDVDFSTMSGDIDNGCVAKNLYLKTMSGDIKSIIDANYANISSTSGDIDVNLKHIQNTVFNTTSGDIDITSNDLCSNANLTSLSGKIKDKSSKNGTGSIVNASTISGDIHLF